MTRPILTLSMFTIFLLIAAAGEGAAGVTTVLLPTSTNPAEIHISRPGGPDSACLTFDLSGVPEEPKRLGVELRLVGFRASGKRPQVVNVYQADGSCRQAEGTESLGFWRIPEAGDLHPDTARVVTSVELEGNQGGLATVVKGAIGGKLELLLRSTDFESDWKYASLEALYKSSTRPRLILTYEAPAGEAVDSADAPQLKFGTSSSQAMDKMASFTNIVSGPLPYEGNVIVIAETMGTTELAALSPLGKELWRCPILATWAVRDKAPGCTGGVRYEDQGDGTVLDCNTKLIWLKDAGCLGKATWQQAQQKVSDLNGMTAGSDSRCRDYEEGKYTDWRLPTISEMCGPESPTAPPRARFDRGVCSAKDAAVGLIDASLSRGSPKVVNARGDATWSEGDAFVRVQSSNYWSSTEPPGGPNDAWSVNLPTGYLSDDRKDFEFWVWPVRGAHLEERIAKTDFATQLREHSGIDGQGRLYNFGTEAVTTYDLTIADLASRCPGKSPFPSSWVANPGGAAPQGPPTISAGGNVYLIGEGRENYVYGLAPGSLQELWRSEKRAGTHVERIAVGPPRLECEPGPRKTARAVCRGTVYALTPGVLRLDAATGEEMEPLRGWKVDESWQPYTPLVTSGPDTDHVVLAATGTSDGLLTAFSGDEEVWTPRKGPVAAQPALAKDAAGPAVLTIQKRTEGPPDDQGWRFWRLHIDTGRTLCRSDEIEGLVCNDADCTSNLVVDADGTAYFLNNSVMYAYGKGDDDKKCKQLFAVKVDRQNDILLGPHEILTHSDTTIWALRDKAPGCAAGMRYKDQGDGTVLDCNTKLIWLKDAGCLGKATWKQAQQKVSDLNRMTAGSDSRCRDYEEGKYTDWRLPAISEMCGPESPTAPPRARFDRGVCPAKDAAVGLIDASVSGSPKVVNARGDATWSEGDAFVRVQSHNYWSSTEPPGGPNDAWSVNLPTGYLSDDGKDFEFWVWPVRGTRVVDGDR